MAGPWAASETPICGGGSSDKHMNNEPSARRKTEQPEQPEDPKVPNRVLALILTYVDMNPKIPIYIWKRKLEFSDHFISL